ERVGDLPTVRSTSIRHFLVERGARVPSTVHATTDECSHVRLLALLLVLRAPLLLLSTSYKNVVTHRVVRIAYENPTVKSGNRALESLVRVAPLASLFPLVNGAVLNVRLTRSKYRGRGRGGRSFATTFSLLLLFSFYTLTRLLLHRR